MKFYNKIIMLVVLISIGFPQHYESLDGLLETNLQVQAAKKAYDAANAKIKVAGTLPDPMLETSFSIDPIETRNGPIENQIMVGQKFPLWGKLRKERNIQKLSAEISRTNYRNTKLQISFQLRRHLAEYQKHNTSLEILNEYLDELQTFTSITRSQYANGIGKTLHPILKLQIEESIVRSQINNTESLITEVSNKLKSLFNDDIKLQDLPDEAIDTDNFSDGEWIEIAKQHNPQFLIAQTGLVIAEQKHKLSKLQKLPDLIAGATYSLVGPTNLGGAVSSGQDALGIKIGFSLPIWFTKNKSRVKSASYSIAKQESILEDTWNNIEADLGSIFKEIDELNQNIALYKESINKDLEQMIKSAYSAYEVGDLDYLDLLDSIRLNFRSKLEFENLKAQQKILRAKLLSTAGLISLN